MRTAIFATTSDGKPEVGALVGVDNATPEMRAHIPDESQCVYLDTDKHAEIARQGAQAFAAAMQAGEKTMTISVEAFAAAFAMYAEARHKADNIEAFAADVATSFAILSSTLGQMGVNVHPQADPECKGTTLSIDIDHSVKVSHVTRHIHPAPDVSSVMLHVIMLDMLEPARIIDGERPKPQTH